jgi:hypothetical protein
MEQATPVKQKKLVAAVTLPPEIQKRVADLAEKREWSIAQTGGYLIKLGLEKLKEIAEQEPDSTLNPEAA